MSLTQRLQCTSGCKRFMMNHHNLMTCMGWKWSWNVNLEKFSKAKKCWRRTGREGRGAPPFFVFCSFSSFLVSFRSWAWTHARHIWRQKATNTKQLQKGSLYSPLLHLSFVCFVCFTSCRTEPSSAVTAAKYYSDYSHNLFLSYWSPFLRVLCVLIPDVCGFL